MLENRPLRVGTLLWLLAMSGVVALTVIVLPQVIARLPQRVPLGLPLAAAASLVQNALIVAAAVWLGIALGRPLGLSAPALEAAASGGDIVRALKPQLAPALLGGVAAGGLLLLAIRWTPAALVDAGRGLEIPLLVRILYGGVTEETLMRWGLMTALLWLSWRFLQRGEGMPRQRYVWASALIASVAFGVLHLPAVMAIGVELSAPVVSFVVVGNSLPGLLFGYLYWRYGLEAAIGAHGLAHVVATLAVAL
ncbi:CPBP family intramembrane glutamic endopeptidase [Tahibacter sp.]|uniref:CPBP family intramembrane glutamic endopeptidase n=1 Tax=Tahibacter sp. TaxID=2056211 RepID=UPI0028C3F336|nr:CPBP family intramembrane glutamic endopeptidase [Tahibacter sp.]